MLTSVSRNLQSPNVSRWDVRGEEKASVSTPKASYQEGSQISHSGDRTHNDISASKQQTLDKVTGAHQTDYSAARLRGVKIYSNDEITAAKGMDKKRFPFWNRKAESICSEQNNSDLKKTEIHGMIDFEWVLVKTELLLEEATTIHDNKSIGRNCDRVEELTGDVKSLCSVAEKFNAEGKLHRGELVEEELTAKSSMLRKAQTSLSHAIRVAKLRTVPCEDNTKLFKNINAKIGLDLCAMQSETQTEVTPAITVPIVTAHIPKPHPSHYFTTPTSSAQLERRSSKRSIKRKRFDDEVVESSLIKQDRPPKLKGFPAFEFEKPVREIIKKEVIAPPLPEKRKPSVGKVCRTSKSHSRNRSRKQKVRAPAPASTKDLGRWKPTDDLALVTGVQQTNDLTAVYLGVKFSCKFTLKEIQERWYSLLYDPIISKLSVQAMKQFHPDVLTTVQAKTLYSKEEEALLGKVASTSSPTIEMFQDLLLMDPDVFYPTRTPKALHNHWLLMKQYHLLPDQSVQPMPRGDHVLNFSDAEDLLTDEDLKDGKDDSVEHELAIADRRNKKEIRHLEQELPKWQVLVDSVTGISPPDFDNQTLAVLRGRLVRYLMRSREITLGRATKDNQIDVDLSLEGPAWKISRRQGAIKLRNNGDFYIANEGKRPLYIDGKPILTGNKQRLNNNSVVEISCLRFIFLINQDLISVIRNESQKIPPSST